MAKFSCTQSKDSISKFLNREGEKLTHSDDVEVIKDPNKLVLSNGMEFMRVPAGKFIMGSNSGMDDEKPQHTLSISYGYWMARYPVTMEQDSIYRKSVKYISVSGWTKKKNHPIENASWNHAMEYCQWLNKRIKGELPSGLVLRLPTESEWEKAARGTKGREYPWGNKFDIDKCNSYVYESKIHGTTPVGLYSPQGDSPYGCADMFGNVLEWTHSEYKAYPYIAEDGREKAQTNVVHVARGVILKTGTNCAFAKRDSADEVLPQFVKVG